MSSKPYTMREVRELLFDELSLKNIKISGHKLIQQGKKFVELNDVYFEAMEDSIIDAPEYSDVADGSWYDKHYMPRVNSHIDAAVSKLINDHGTRHCIIQIFDILDHFTDDLPCTMYMSVRLVENSDKQYVLQYTIHMRSLDAREYRSDIKFHRRIIKAILAAVRYRCPELDIIDTPYVTLFANSLQCWDKDWNTLTNDFYNDNNIDDEDGEL